MKKFLAIYTGSPAARQKSGWDQLEETMRQEKEAAGMKGWGDWMAAHRAVIVDSGGPLGKTKRIGPEGITDISNAIAGYVIVQAESHQAAAQLFEKHPHFMIFPGDSVEIMECLPIPGR